MIAKDFESLDITKAIDYLSKENIIEASFNSLNYPRKTIAGKSRKEPIAIQRHFYCKLLTDCEKPFIQKEIAKPINRDRSTVSTSVQRVNDILIHNVKWQSEYNEIQQKFYKNLIKTYYELKQD